MRTEWRQLVLASTAVWIVLVVCGCDRRASRVRPASEADNPIRPIPAGPLGTGIDLQSLKDPPTPARVRLGRWLFFDRRLSSDGSVACATGHRPEYAFSQPTPVATGIHGVQGRRKVPPILNLAIAFPPTSFRTGPQAAFFWDGRVSSLERQALQPIANPGEMGSTEAALVQTLQRIGEYPRYNRGANPNPYLSAFIRPLGLTSAGIDDIVAFLEALSGEGWQDVEPARFPQ